ncbi:hypothetical protein JCM8097_005063 [Rhodosporidiobolus ruineniae]
MSTPSSAPADDVQPPPPSYSAAISSPLLVQGEQQQSYGSSGGGTAHAGHPAFQHQHAHLNLPSGYFLLRNRAQGKALDLLGHKTHEGAEFGLHPIKQPQLKGLSLQHSQNNQLFFLDWDGHLMANAASRAVDVEAGQLSLAYPHPVMSIPSSLSHPLPRFRLDPETSTLHVLFSSDPYYRGPHAPSDWQDDDFIVESVPLRRKAKGKGKAPNEFLNELGSKANDVLGGLGERFGQLGIFGARSAPSSPNPNRFAEQELPLPPPPVPEKAPSVPPSPPTDRVRPGASASASPLPSPRAAALPSHPAAAEDDPSSDSDSEPSAYRPVRVVRLPRSWRDKFPSSALRAAPNTSLGVTQWPASSKELRMWRRRMWEVVPVTVQPVYDDEDKSGGGRFLAPSPAGSSRSSDSENEYGSDDVEEGEDDLYPVDEPHERRRSEAVPPALLATLSSAATAAQGHATSAASALSGILSTASSSLPSFIPRPTSAPSPSPSPSPPLPDLPARRATQEGEWDDAAVLESEEIAELGVAREGDGLVESEEREGERREVAEGMRAMEQAEEEEVGEAKEEETDAVEREAVKQEDEAEKVPGAVEQVV